MKTRRQAKRQLELGTPQTPPQALPIPARRGRTTRSTSTEAQHPTQSGRVTKAKPSTSTTAKPVKGRKPRNGEAAARQAASQDNSAGPSDTSHNERSDADASRASSAYPEAIDEEMNEPQEATSHNNREPTNFLNGPPGPPGPPVFPGANYVRIPQGETPGFQIPGLNFASPLSSAPVTPGSTIANTQATISSSTRRESATSQLFKDILEGPPSTTSTPSKTSQERAEDDGKDAMDVPDETSPIQSPPEEPYHEDTSMEDSSDSADSSESQNSSPPVPFEHDEVTEYDAVIEVSSNSSDTSESSGSSFPTHSENDDPMEGGSDSSGCCESSSSSYSNPAEDDEEMENSSNSSFSPDSSSSSDSSESSEFSEFSDPPPCAAEEEPTCPEDCPCKHIDKCPCGLHYPGSCIVPRRLLIKEIPYLAHHPDPQVRRFAHLITGYPKKFVQELTIEELAFATDKPRDEVVLNRAQILSDYKKSRAGSANQTTSMRTSPSIDQYPSARLCEVKKQQIRNEEVAEDIRHTIRNWDKYPTKRTQRGAVVKHVGISVTENYDEYGNAYMRARTRPTPIPVVEENPTFEEEDSSDESASEDETLTRTEERPAEQPTTQEQSNDPTTQEKSIEPSTPKTRGWGFGSILPSAARTVTKFIPSFGRHADTTDNSTTQKHSVPATEPQRPRHVSATQGRTANTSRQRKKREPSSGAVLRTPQEKARRIDKKEARKKLEAELNRLREVEQEHKKMLAKPPPEIPNKATLRFAKAREAEEKHEKELKEAWAKKEADGFREAVETGRPPYATLDINDAGEGTKQKRKRPPTPDVIPNPPGTSFGLDERYFGDYSDDEESDRESTKSAGTPSKRRRTKEPEKEPEDAASSPTEALYTPSTDPTYASWVGCRKAVHRPYDWDTYIGLGFGRKPEPVKKVDPRIRHAPGGGRIFEVLYSDSESDPDESFEESGTQSQSTAKPLAKTPAPRASEQVTRETPTPKAQPILAPKAPESVPPPSNASQQPAVQSTSGPTRVESLETRVAKQKEMALKYTSKTPSRLQQSSRLSQSTVASEDGGDEAEEPISPEKPQQNVSSFQGFGLKPATPWSSRPLDQNSTLFKGLGSAANQTQDSQQPQQETPFKGLGSTTSQAQASPQTQAPFIDDPSSAASGQASMPPPETQERQESLFFPQTSGATSKGKGRATEQNDTVAHPEPDAAGAESDDHYDPLRDRIRGLKSPFRAYEQYKENVMTEQSSGLVDSSWNPRVDPAIALDKVKRNLKEFIENEAQKQNPAAQASSNDVQTTTVTSDEGSTNEETPRSPHPSVDELFDEPAASSSGNSTIPPGEAEASGPSASNANVSSGATGSSGPPMSHNEVFDYITGSSSSSTSNANISPALTGERHRLTPRVQEFIDQNYTKEHKAQALPDFISNLNNYKRGEGQIA